MRNPTQKEIRFTDEIALALFRKMLQVGVPFSEIVRLLLRNKNDRTIKQLAKEIGFNETLIHKNLSGERRHFEDLSSLLVSYLGFDPFVEAESVLGSPVYRDPRSARRRLPHTRPSGIEKDFKRDSADPGLAFFAWVRQGIRSGDLKVNGPMVHIVPAGALLKGVLLVSPAIFEAHLKALEPESAKGISKTRVRRLQGFVEKVGINIQTSRQTNIHAVKDRGSQSVLNGFLFPLEVFFKPGEHPPFSQNLT